MLGGYLVARRDGVLAFGLSDTSSLIEPFENRRAVRVAANCLAGNTVLLHYLERLISPDAQSASESDAAGDDSYVRQMVHVANGLRKNIGLGPTANISEAAELVSTSAATDAIQINGQLIHPECMESREVAVA